MWEGLLAPFKEKGENAILRHSTMEVFRAVQLLFTCSHIIQQFGDNAVCVHKMTEKTKQYTENTHRNTIQSLQKENKQVNHA